MVLPAGSHDELTHAARRIGPAGRILWCESLVVVIVTVEDHVRAGRVQVSPERVVRRLVAVLPGREARMMPVRERACRRVGGEVGSQPALLG